MNKIHTIRLQTLQQEVKRKAAIVNKENDSTALNKNKAASFFILEKKKKIISDSDEETSTKKRATSPNPSQSSSETQAESKRSVSTKKKYKNETIQERLAFPNFKRRKYSELKKENKFQTTQKKRIVLPKKKIFRDKIKFSDDATDTIHTFPLYADKDILNIYFKAELIEQDLDNDVETDEDQLKDAKKLLISSLKDGIKEYKKKCK
jgi:hypothetical protein